MATQPGTGLTVFNPQAGAPAHVAAFFNEQGTNIAPRQTVPSLSPEGKTWTISADGQKTKLQLKNSDGDLEPLSIMKVVVLDYAKQRGRAYYEGEYDPANVSAPICWSDDGVTPDDSLQGPYNTADPAVAARFAKGGDLEGTSRKISAACANCPMAVKGSKVTPQGKAVSACSQHRMLAVIPEFMLGRDGARPLRLKLAMTSDWDKQSPDQAQQGWHAFSNYVDYLVANNVKHTAAVISKMKFDPMAPYPKVFFATDRYLSETELPIVAQLSKSEEVTKLLGGTWTPAGVDGVKKEEQAAGQPSIPGSPPATLPAAAPPPVEPQYVMAAGETFTEEQYTSGGWTRQQLIDNGKLVPATPTAPPPAAVPPPAPAQEIVAEPIATPQPVAAPAATLVIDEAPAPAEPVAAVVVEETVAALPADAPAQAPAQAEAPPPVPPPAQPDPAPAAAAAQAAAPAVSTEVPANVEALLAEWGDAPTAATV